MVFRGTLTVIIAPTNTNNTNNPNIVVAMRYPN
jgi:hypothetical protein